MAEIVKGGVRARGAVPKVLTPENTEDVAPGELAIGDAFLHDKYRGPITVTAKSVDDATGIVTLNTDKATMTLGPAAVVRRVIPIETEESEP